MQPRRPKRFCITIFGTLEAYWSPFRFHVAPLLSAILHRKQVTNDQQCPSGHVGTCRRVQYLSWCPLSGSTPVQGSAAASMQMVTGGKWGDEEHSSSRGGTWSRPSGRLICLVSPQWWPWALLRSPRHLEVESGVWRGRISAARSWHQP